MIYSGIYCLYLEHYVYVKVLKDEVFLLNTLDYSRIKSCNKSLVSLFTKMLDNNFKAIEIDFDKEHNDADSCNLFDEIRLKYMGDLIPKHLYKSTPFYFNSSNAKVLNNALSLVDGIGVDYDKSRNSLLSISIYLNSDCFNTCIDCVEYCKQFVACSKFSSNITSLNIDLLKKIFDGVQFSNLNRINLLGGDISLYEYLDELFDYMTPYRDKCYTVVNCLNIGRLSDDILLFFDNRISVMIDVDLFSNIQELENLINICDKYSIIFVVRSERDVNLVMEILDHVECPNYSLMPFWDSGNLDFFTKHVFMSEEDLFSELQSMRDIHRNQHLNSLFYGELFICPNGDVYSNMNDCLLGNISKDSIINLIATELIRKDSAWFLTRNKTTCLDCIFTDICPPVSNYELLSDRFNSCVINVK